MVLNKKQCQNTQTLNKLTDQTNKQKLIGKTDTFEIVGNKSYNLKNDM